MVILTNEAMRSADRIVRQCGTRDPDAIAASLGLIVMPRAFKRQKGVYTVIKRNRYIFLKADLAPVMRSIVLLHEIGHDTLHRQEAIRSGGMQEFSLFDMSDRRMEYEANLFAAQIALPEDELLPYVYEGFDLGQIASALNSDINLVALKLAEMKRMGYRFREVESRSDFLRA